MTGSEGSAGADGGWVVYVLLSHDTARTYVGVALDAVRRLAQHNGELPGGARATRAGRPWTLEVVYPGFSTRAEAQGAEYEVKRLRGRRRLEWPAA